MAQHLDLTPTPRSSLTIVDHEYDHHRDGGHDRAKPNPKSLLDQEISKDEERFEMYGGDDPHDPDSAQSTSLDTSAEGVLPDASDTNLVTWDGSNDPENPQKWSRSYKWMVTILCAVMTLNVTFASSAPTVASSAIRDQFDVPYEVTYLITTVFLLGYVFGPIFWAPGSELIGRRPIFWSTMIIYTILQLGQALAHDIQTLLITRFLSGFFAVAPLTNSGGVIADMWDPVGRGPATSLFVASVFLGPVIGPIVGGLIMDSPLGWRWVFWVMMIFAGVCSIIAFLIFPETYAPVILAKKAKRLRKADPQSTKDLYAEHERQEWSIVELLHRTLFRPFIMLAREPILTLVTIYVSLVYGLLYALFQAFPIIFHEKRGMSASMTGLMFIGVGIGSTLGAVINVVFTARHFNAAVMEKWKGFPPPENRLYGGMLAGPSLVIGVFWLGWTGQYANIPWYVPALSSILLGMSVSLVFMSFLSYLIDTYLMYTASAFAANTLVRSAVAAAFPLFTVQMFTKLGVNWACTLLGLLALVLLPSPFLFFKYGARIRASSKFAPAIDLRIAKELAAEAEKNGEA